jgi:nitroimidazol reductase NimA-like FMN-containing flavoprotein (pyridoxamine 5'-phosphate oxidase superfamily)
MANAPGMTEVEVENFLSKQKTPMRLGTSEVNGDPQIHPVWYHFENGKLYLMSDKSVRKVQNIRRKSTVYFSVDTDAVPNKGVKGKGNAKILTEPAKIVPLAEKIVAKYLGDAKGGMGKGLVDSVKSGSEVVVEITPHYYSVWDYSKMR